MKRVIAAFTIVCSVLVADSVVADDCPSGLLEIYPYAGIGLMTEMNNAIERSLPELGKPCQPEVLAEPEQPKPLYIPEPVTVLAEPERPKPLYIPEPVTEVEPLYIPEPITEVEPLYIPEPITEVEPLYIPEPVTEVEPIYIPEPEDVSSEPPLEEDLPFCHPTEAELGCRKRSFLDGLANVTGAPIIIIDND